MIQLLSGHDSALQGSFTPVRKRDTGYPGCAVTVYN